MPDTSIRYIAAQLAAIRARIGAGAAVLSEKDLVMAGNALAHLELDEARRAEVTRELLEAALAWVRERVNGAPPATSGTVLGRSLKSASRAYATS